MKAWKKIALEEAEEEIIDVEDAGNEIERFTDFHWRINGIDVWPSSKKYREGNTIKHYSSLKKLFKI